MLHVTFAVLGESAEAQVSPAFSMGPYIVPSLFLSFQELHVSVW